MKQNVLKTAEDITRIQSSLQTQQDPDIIKWLAPMDHGSQHSRYWKLREPKTGMWFLNSKEYNTWRGSAGKLLFCQGMPGAGKSVLSALVIEKLSSIIRQTPSIGLAYIYCDYGRREHQTPLYLISSLTQQLCLLSPTLPPCVKALHDLHHLRTTRPLLKEMCQVFQETVQSFTQVYVVIDALDELSAKAGYLRTFLDELLKAKRSSSTLSMLFTSRHLALQDVRHYFNDAIKVDISALRGDIEKFIDGHVSKLSPTGPIRTYALLEREVKNTVAQAAKGM